MLLARGQQVYKCCSEHLAGYKQFNVWWEHETVVDVLIQKQFLAVSVTLNEVCICLNQFDEKCHCWSSPYSMQNTFTATGVVFNY